MAKFDQFAEGGGAVIDKPKPVEKKKTRAQRLKEWQASQGGQPAIEQARAACMCCTPTRAQLLLAQQWEDGPPDL